MAGATLISTSAVWVRLADVDPTATGVYRMGLGAVGLFILAFVKSWDRWRGWRYAARFLPMGAFFALDLFLWHRSIHYVGPGLATVLASCQVFVLAAVGTMFLGEKFDWRLPVSLVLAVPGVVLLVGIDVSALSDDYLIGVAMGLGTAVAYSGFLLGLRKAQSEEDALRAAPNVMYASIWTALLLVVVALVTGESFEVPDTQSGLSLLAYGVVCQVVAWYLMTDAMPELPASVVGLTLLLQPSLAMVWDVLFFERPASLVDLGAGAMVLAGIYLAYTRGDAE